MTVYAAFLRRDGEDYLKGVFSSPGLAEAFVAESIYAGAWSVRPLDVDALAGQGLRMAWIADMTIRDRFAIRDFKPAGNIGSSESPVQEVTCGPDEVKQLHRTDVIRFLSPVSREHAVAAAGAYWAANNPSA